MGAGKNSPGFVCGGGPLFALFVSLFFLLVIPVASDASQVPPRDSLASTGSGLGGQTVGGTECMIEPWECEEPPEACIQEVGAPCPEEPSQPCIQEVGAPCPEEPGCMIEPWECEEPPEACIQEVGAPCPEQPQCMIEPWECSPGEHVADSSNSTNSIQATAPLASEVGHLGARSSAKTCVKRKALRGSRCVRRGLVRKDCRELSGVSRHRCMARRTID
jgi:hypothetical protein